ncbi:unnamed protein product [Schistosoma margrebowiei]|uniref:Uncharacterized protein n=1 Tax=Schistosoma margrebowiei TaxID=48269 RepID=A0AA85A038_9TREM|nr:unnamed protein product [Schistosoma margrebowiei]
MESKLKEKQQSNSLIIDENELKEYKSTAKQYDSIPIEEKANILKLKIINELESKYREQILILQSDLKCYQDQNRLLIDAIQNLNKTLIDERLEFKNLKLLYEAEISSLKKIKDDQNIQLDQLTSMKTNEDKKLLLQNAQLQAKCQELNNQLSYFKENLSTERDKIQSDNIDQLLKVKNMELDALCSTQKTQLGILTEEVNNLRKELMNQQQTSIESTKHQVNTELQIEQLINSIRTELFDIRNEAQAQRFEIENQRNELMKKSKALNHELSLLSSRLTNSNQFEALTTNYNMTTNTTSTRTSKKEDTAAADDEDDEKIQQIIKLFRNHFMVHINEFENKVTSITERLNLEVNQMQTFKIYANSLIEKINTTESKQKSLLLTDHNNQRILKHLDISNAIRNKMQQFIEDSRKKKRALCLRIVLLKRKLNFFEYEVEKLRKENNNLKENVSIAEYERVCMAYKDLYRRHQEYERIILNSDNQKFIIKSNDFQ